MKLALFGTSGLADEAAHLGLELGASEVVLVHPTDPAPGSRAFRIVPEHKVGTLAEEGYKFAIAIGDPRIRSRLHDAYPDLSYTSLVHPTATIPASQRALLPAKPGNIIMAGVRFTSSITFGSFGIYNPNCTISHDCEIGNYVTIGPGANLCGNVRLAEGVYVGAGSVVLPGHPVLGKLSLGDYAIIGAGAVVTRSVPARITVKGNPAR
ncbi:hypothetical protein [Paenibacillus daejeonensis]|uniref:hypothetical protein n=1 Tax=Paenibacillus daejeonensis TaxID=135193 RepID=UPI0003796D75|nr:hypothetical protein [Paenibacillus daejeonensis]